MQVTVLASGVDTLHVSARGQLRAEVVERLEDIRRQAQDSEDSVVFEFEKTGQAFLFRPYGLRGYRFWLSSPDFELILGVSEKFPAALLQLHAAYLHSCGLDLGFDLIDLLLRHDVFTHAPELTVSRLDLYADFQGWQPAYGDLHRLICQGRRRRSFEEAFTSGRRLTGFMLGKGGLVARLYDKSEEIRRKGTVWHRDMWPNANPELPVWRLEFQFRRLVLSDFHLKSIGEVLASRQDLWRYATGTWLSLRRPTRDRQAKHWPEDRVWAAIRAVEIAPASTGVIRRRIEQAREETLIRGLMGYATSLGAVRGQDALRDALRDAIPLVSGYLQQRSRTFETEVRRKRNRLLTVTAPIDDRPLNREA